MICKQAFVDSAITKSDMLLFFVPILVGLIMMFNVCISGTMAPKATKNEIQTLQQRLRDESSEDQGNSEASGSLNEVIVQSHIGTEQPKTQVIARQLGKPQTQAIVVRSPQSDKEGDIDNSSIQMTPSREGSESKSGEESEFESLLAP